MFRKVFKLTGGNEIKNEPITETITELKQLVEEQKQAEKIEEKLENTIAKEQALISQQQTQLAETVTKIEENKEIIQAKSADIVSSIEVTKNTPNYQQLTFITVVPDCTVANFIRDESTGFDAIGSIKSLFTDDSIRDVRLAVESEAKAESVGCKMCATNNKCLVGSVSVTFVPKEGVTLAVKTHMIKCSATKDPTIRKKDKVAQYVQMIKDAQSEGSDIISYTAEWDKNTRRFVVLKSGITKLKPTLLTLTLKKGLTATTAMTNIGASKLDTQVKRLLCKLVVRPRTLEKTLSYLSHATVTTSSPESVSVPAPTESVAVAQLLTQEVAQVGGHSEEYWEKKYNKYKSKYLKARNSL